jgi:putative nucleotidyltransferase with HDIG domain
MKNQQDILDFNKFISSISLALDLAESCVFTDQRLQRKNIKAFSELDVQKHNFTSHSKKTALIALHIARHMGYQGERLNNLYIATFLHDIGAVDALSYCHTQSDFILEHCEFGAEIIKKLPVFHDISPFIKFHHEQYDGSGPYGLHSAQIPQEAQIIHIADYFELICSQDTGVMQRALLIDWIQSKRNIMFDPYLTDVLLEIAERERFWLDLENITRDHIVFERIQPKIETPMQMEQLADIASVFASIIDKKSQFTHDHSFGLAHNAGKIASLYGFDPQKSQRLMVAGLLHDLGKLSVPNSILDKPGKLTKEEYAVIRSHSYYTRLVLDKINGIEDICRWASNHHEALNGKGYPEALTSQEICLESRIISVCDVYQALTEHRPYRTGMSRDSALKIIDDMVRNDSLDEAVVKRLKDIL